MHKIEGLFIGSSSFMAISFINLFQNTTFTDIVTALCQITVAAATFYKLIKETSPKDQDRRK